MKIPNGFTQVKAGRLILSDKRNVYDITERAPGVTDLKLVRSVERLDNGLIDLTIGASAESKLVEAEYVLYSIERES